MDRLQADIEAVGSIDAVPSILEVICRTTGMGCAAVARVTEERWVACQVLDGLGSGLASGSEIDIGMTVCDQVRRSHQAVVLDDVAKDPVFGTHAGLAAFGIQSYVSMPIFLPDGEFFGTLCGLHPRPLVVSAPETVAMFRLFAQLIGFHLQAIRRLHVAESELRDEKRDAGAREQFIAILGHDLRNPLASVNAACRVLLRMPLPDQAEGVVKVIQQSSARMSGLIDNVTDFARGRLGDGLPLKRRAGFPLAPLLEQVMAECRAIWPDHTIEADLSGAGTLDCDPVRIGQLLDNLLTAALADGAPQSPVRVGTALEEGTFCMTVSFKGEALSAEMLESLFKPFHRGGSRPGKDGLGLGLYVASEIAKAHGGTLRAVSCPDDTRFILSIPATAS
jgi:signal transduction histidine kinase